MAEPSLISRLYRSRSGNANAEVVVSRPSDDNCQQLVQQLRNLLDFACHGVAHVLDALVGGYLLQQFRTHPQRVKTSSNIVYE
jgi:hypothetical protein